jgi:hypothetical protein
MQHVSSEMNALQLDEIIGSTLSSVVKAQGMMSSQLADFIEQVGFEKPEPGKAPKARTFSFSFNRTEQNPTTGAMENRQVTAELPLLSILSLPCMAVDEASIDFELKVVAHNEPPASPTPKAIGKLGQREEPRKLYTVQARKTPIRQLDGTKSVETTGTLKVKVVVRRQETMGIQKIQALLDSATKES